MLEGRLASALGVYVHLPFCPYVCPYCDFAKERWNAARAERYLHALERETRSIAPVAASTLFVGGGTPNAYPPERVAALITALRERFELAADAETTVECNPDAALCASFEAYAGAGVTRISFGVQSFEAAEIKTLGRRHTASDVASAVARAREAGIANISLDLMFGIPDQTAASLERSLDAAIALAPEHISAYGLTVEEETPYARWREREPERFDDDVREAAFYERIIAKLEAAGYEHYELSNFARPGFRCRHNENYWNDGEYLGLGVGAASHLGGVRTMRTKSLDAYCDAVEAGRPVPGEHESLSGAQKAGEGAMLALRRREGIDASEFARRYGRDLFGSYRGVIDEYAGLGLLEEDASGVRLTLAGRFLANDVAAAFLAPAEAA